MISEKIRHFLWPNRGVLGIFLVWAAVFVISLLSNPALDNLLQDWSMFAQAVVLNLVIFYLLSCLSAWAYEKLKGRRKRR
jgi:membrane-anchored protein YejM (alkaline phosphatase superfamily)